MEKNGSNIFSLWQERKQHLHHFLRKYTKLFALVFSAVIIDASYLFQANFFIWVLDPIHCCLFKNIAFAIILSSINFFLSKILSLEDNLYFILTELNQ